MGRKIILGVTGSIAAYKACELVRLFVKNGDDVHVVMTRAAKEFVTELTFRTLSRNPVGCDMFASPAEWKPEHVALAETADLVVIAPATADVIAKIAHGFADDLLTATVLACAAPLYVAPAMNSGMWESPVTQENFEMLAKHGARFIGMDVGDLACGSSGTGRMAEPQRIFDEVGDGE